MEVLEYIKKNNLEYLGRHYLKLASQSFSKGEITEAYTFLRLGLDFITDDDFHLNWRSPNPSSFDIFDAKLDSEFNFCKAYSVCYNCTRDIPTLEFNLKLITSFLRGKINDGHGWYVQGLLLISLKRYHEALECLEFSHRLQNSHRVQYKIGILKERFLKTYGINHLYDAYLLNPSSGRCFTALQNYSYERKIFEATYQDCKNFLITSLTSSQYYLFIEHDISDFFIQHFLRDSYSPAIEPTEQVFEELLHFLYSHKIIFQQENYIKDCTPCPFPFLPEPAPTDPLFWFNCKDEDSNDYHHFDTSSSYEYVNHREGYFDAMTDGQLGSYWDYQGGTDYIGDWAGE